MACGPSARALDLATLRGEQLLLVNDAALRHSSFAACAHATPTPAAALFSLDNQWVRRRRHFLESWAGEKHVALPLESWPECAGIAGVNYLGWSHADGLSDEPDVICTGGNSGYGAINLAYLKGAREIYLLGYDMDAREDEKYIYWAPRFRTMLPQLKARGVRVVNLNPDSHIDAFPRVDPGKDFTWQRKH